MCYYCLLSIHGLTESIPNSGLYLPMKIAIWLPELICLPLAYFLGEVDLNQLCHLPMFMLLFFVSKFRLKTEITVIIGSIVTGFSFSSSFFQSAWILLLVFWFSVAIDLLFRQNESSPIALFESEAEKTIDLALILERNAFKWFCFSLAPLAFLYSFFFLKGKIPWDYHCNIKT